VELCAPRIRAATKNKYNTYTNDIYIPLHTPQNTSNLGHNNSATKNSINNTQPPPRNTTVLLTLLQVHTRKRHTTLSPFSGRSFFANMSHCMEEIKVPLLLLSRHYFTPPATICIMISIHHSHKQFFFFFFCDHPLFPAIPTTYTKYIRLVTFGCGALKCWPQFTSCCSSPPLEPLLVLVVSVMLPSVSWM